MSANQSLEKPYREGVDALQEFQLSQIPISEKSTKDFGLKISQKIWGYVNSGMGGYYAARNAQFLQNRNYANGIMDIQAMFQDRFQMNGKQNYIRLDWQTLQLVNRIISGLVGRWMARGEKIAVKATDTLSVKQKQEQFEQLEFLIENRKQLEALQEASGVQMIPDEGVPNDKDELKLWQSQFQRIPEEILYELGCNDVLQSNGWFDVLKEKMLHDAAEVLLVGTYAYMDEQGVIHVEWIKPENMIYSWSEYSDFRDWSWLGDVPTMKISTLRKLYGKEFHPDNEFALTEEQIFKIAQTAKEYNLVSNIGWLPSYYTAWTRPYDEWNVRSMRFEFKSVDKEPYTITKTKNTGSTYTQKGNPKTVNGKEKQKPSNNQTIVEDSNINIYRGVYLPDNQVLLEWGLKKNMIRPQDPKEIGNAESSYSFVMPQNFLMRNMGIPQKIKAAVDGMILALLKMQQLMARLVPSGWAIDETALQNVDYGLGNDNNQVDQAKHYFQTGLMYYRGLDAEGNRVEAPIKELVNNGFVGQMDGLIKNYQFNYQTLKDELGEDPNLITQAAQPRVAVQNVEVSQQQADNATDYVYRAYAECMKITGRKISCLLKDSVMYGAEAYRHIVGQEDIDKRMFSTDIKFLPTQMEVQRFEANLNNALAVNKDLVLFVNPFQLVEVAKENYKLAWELFYQSQKKCIAWQAQTAQQNQEATIKGQIASAQEAEKSKQQTETVKGEIEIAKTKVQEESSGKNAIITMVTSMLSKGEPIPASLMPLVDATVTNMMIPLLAQNEEMKNELIKKYTAAQLPEQNEEMQPQEQQPIQPQMQPQAAA